MEDAKKELVLTLIKAELRNTKLIKGIQDAGLVADGFYIELSFLILEQMGFDPSCHSDDLLEVYFSMLDSKCTRPIHQFTSNINTYAEEIYAGLMKKKNNLLNSR